MRSQAKWGATPMCPPPHRMILNHGLEADLRLPASEDEHDPSAIAIATMMSCCPSTCICELIDRNDGECS